MQVLCKSTNDSAEVCCSVCGQGFVMFWDRQSSAERVAALAEIQSVLVNHHRSTITPLAHPNNGFLVPAWDGPVAYSAAALLGHAPAWAI